MTNIARLNGDPFAELGRDLEQASAEHLHQDAVGAELALRDKLPTSMEETMMADARDKLAVLQQNRRVLEAQHEVDGRAQANEHTDRSNKRLESIAHHEAEIVRLRDLDAQDANDTRQAIATMGDKYDKQYRSLDRMIDAQQSVLSSLASNMGKVINN